MTTHQASEILKQHNEWRRGNEVQMIHPSVLGNAIDVMLAFYEGTQQYVGNTLIPTPDFSKPATLYDGKTGEPVNE